MRKQKGMMTKIKPEIGYKGRKIIIRMDAMGIFAHMPGKIIDKTLKL